MVNYKNGKIYIWFIGRHTYIGSTAHTLEVRFQKHLSKFKLGFTYPVYKKLREIGINDISKKLVLLRDYPCQSKDELEREEQRWIDELQPDLNSTKAHSCYTEKRSNVTVKCQCGIDSLQRHLARHRRSKGHRKWMIENNITTKIPSIQKRSPGNCPCGGHNHRRRHKYSKRHQIYLAVKKYCPRADLVLNWT